MSSLWGFSSSGVETQSATSSPDTNEDFNNVLAILYQSLPQISLDSQHTLKADKSLGTGSMFHVRREIFHRVEPPADHYVAVKYMRVEEKPDKQRQIESSLLRELRTILHPQLKGHPHIVSIFGYGWAGALVGESTPFLVMEYAEYGTLSEALRATKLQRHVTLQERYELVVDVACGLKALHESDIIHGDLKASNVLVYQRTEPLGYTFGDSYVPWVAKLADFGSCLTRDEANGHVYQYTGTTVYNAPEIGPEVAFTTSGSFVEYRAADVYSFGILVWETLKVGSFYLSTVEERNLLAGKRPEDFLTEVHKRENDKMLDMALETLQDVRDEMEEAGLGQIWATVAEVLASCLRRWPPQRANSGTVYERLRLFASGDRPPVVYSLPRMRSQPVVRPKAVGASIFNRSDPLESSSYTHLEYYPTFLANERGGQKFRAVAKNEKVKTESRVIPFDRVDPRSSGARSFGDNPISLLKGDMSPRPPREIQERMVEAWKSTVAKAEDTESVCAALMELSASCFLGFGGEQDLGGSLGYIKEARNGSPVAKAILARLNRVLTCNGNEERPSQYSSNPSYFSNRVHIKNATVFVTPNAIKAPQLSIRPSSYDTEEKPDLILSLVKKNQSEFIGLDGATKLEVLEKLWTHVHPNEHMEISQVAISATLTRACKMGIFEAARILASMCVSFIGTRGEPTPLHWLIRFSPDQARYMADTLIIGDQEERDSSVGSQFQITLMNGQGKRNIKHRGICHHLANAQSSCGIYTPENCMELIGSPLHWAVRCHNLELAQHLIALGADVSLRCRIRNRLPGEPPMIAPLNYNALDIALEYHLYDIASEILRQANASGKPIEIGASLLARTTTTFSRYIIHGASFRLALKKTIQVLVDFGWDVNRPDFFEEIPIIVALRNCAEEKYIIEELLQASPKLDEISMPDGMNLATLVAVNSEPSATLSAWKMKQVLPFVADLNVPDESGRNALHYCALLGNAHIARLLLATKRIDVNIRVSHIENRRRATPLILAAEYGRNEVVHLLLEHGADIELPNGDGVTALELAVLNRQFDTASSLILAGAKTKFGVGNEPIPRSTVLHAACIQGSGRPPLTRRLLKAHEELRAPALINCPALGFNSARYPLHFAITFADLESAEALLEFGADPEGWWHPPNLDPSDPITKSKYKVTPQDLVEQILRRALNNRLYKEELRVAMQGHSASTRDLPFLSEREKSEERARWEYTATAARFDFRLEDIQTEKHGQAEIRGFVKRLEEIKRLMEEPLQHVAP